MVTVIALNAIYDKTPSGTASVVPSLRSGCKPISKCIPCLLLTSAEAKLCTAVISWFSYKIQGAATAASQSTTIQWLAAVWLFDACSYQLAAPHPPSLYPKTGSSNSSIAEHYHPVACCSVAVQCLFIPASIPHPPSPSIYPTTDDASHTLPAYWHRSVSVTSMVSHRTLSWL